MPCKNKSEKKKKMSETAYSRKHEERNWSCFSYRMETGLSPQSFIFHTKKKKKQARNKFGGRGTEGSLSKEMYT